MNRLDEIAARAEAASEGPWVARTTGRSGGDHWYVCDDGQSIASIHASDGEDEEQREPDAEFIAHAREDVPKLVAALKAVEALCDDPEHHETQGPHNGYVSVDNLRAAIREALGS